MFKHPEFHNIDDSSDAIVRQLAEGLTAHIYPGDQAMISVVTVAPGAEGSMHDHPEEQWGLCLEGSGIRYQGGEEVAFSKGDFWRTPGGVPPTMRPVAPMTPLAPYLGAVMPAMNDSQITSAPHFSNTMRSR